MTKPLSDIQKDNLILGYCCINTELREQDIFCSRTCRLSTIREKKVEYSYKLARQNLRDLETIIRWNHSNNIYNFRMSSDMFPFSSHQEFCDKYNFEQFRETLKYIGDISKEFNQLLTFHPSQFNQLSSHRECVIINTIVEINTHAKIMDMMGLNSNSIIILHGGSKNGGKAEALSRLATNYKRLSITAQKRLVLENCEMCYTIADLLPISRELNIPIVVDSHHHNINPSPGFTFGELINLAVVIWDRRKLIPVFHISESRSGVLVTDSITSRRGHSNYVLKIPQEFLELSKTQAIYIDIEAKMKERAVRLLHKSYSFHKK